jgi:uroporphyrinogen decarboxylase
MATDRENFLATTEHRRPGRILYHAGFTEDLRRRVVEHIGTTDIEGHYGLYASTMIPIRRPEGVPVPDYTPYWEGYERPAGSWINGIGVLELPSGVYHFTGYVSPLRNATSLKELEEYPLDDVSSWDLSYMRQMVEEAHAAGRVAVGSVGHMYETAWQIRGYEQFLMDTVERPAWAECLLERLATNNLAKAVAFARADVDMLHCGDDVANQQALMFSPSVWRQMHLPRWTRVWRAAKEIHPEIRVWYHSDGNITEIVGDLIEAGMDILNPVQPECLDTDALHRRYGRRITFDGCIGTQSTMPWGTPDEVRARVKDVIEKYGQEGGLIVAPTHVLEPEVPLANIDALFEACREYGIFD